MTQLNSGVYQIRNLVNQKIYIGSSINFNRRKGQHFNKLKKNVHNTKLQHSFNKHGIENFVFEIIEYVEDLTKLIEREQHYIDTLKPWYNLSLTARGGFGEKHTDSAKKKMSDYAKNRSIEHLNKLSNVRIGIHLSEETKDKISKWNIGKIVSDETKSKMKESQLKISIDIKEKRKEKLREYFKNNIIHNKGKKMSEESKIKMLEKRKITQTLKKLMHNDKN